MKKLVIAAALACGIMGAQASTFDWKSANKMYVGDVTLASLTDGQVLTPPTSGTKGYMDSANFSSVTWAAVMTLTYGTESETINITPSFTSHKISNSDVSSTLFSLPSDDTLKTYSWDIVITGTYTGSDSSDWTLTSNTIHGEGTFSNLSDPIITFASPTSWTVAGGSSVPEPTSGLLLLLGMAGLALKRKRA